MMPAKNQKIAIVIYSLRRAGAEKVATSLSRQFTRMGQHVTVIVFDGREQGYSVAGELIDLQLPSKPDAIFFQKALTLIRRCWRLYRIYQQHRFDRIIAFMESAAFPSILSGYPTIVSNHCHPEVYFTRFEWLLSRILYPRARRVVMVSKQGQAGLYKRLGLNNLTCIYNPVDIKTLKQLAVAQPAIIIEGDYIIAVARLEPQKRLDRLLAAFAASGVRKNLKLLILGEGSLRDALQQQITALKLTEQVLMPGNVDNPFPNIKAAKFLVLSSDHEGFPMVLLEALALGRPVISTDCATGPGEIIEQGVNGLLVPVEDVTALTAAMDKLNNSSSYYQQLCSRARASVQHLAIRPVAEQWLAL